MRDLFETEHEDFRRSVRTFMEKEVAPNTEKWDAAGIVPRELWLKAGEAGLLCFDVPEEYGGPGADDFRSNVIVSEEQNRASRSTPTSSFRTSPSSEPTSRSSAGSPAASPARPSPRSP